MDGPKWIRFSIVVFVPPTASEQVDTFADKVDALAKETGLYTQHTQYTPITLDDVPPDVLGLDE